MVAPLQGDRAGRPRGLEPQARFLSQPESVRARRGADPRSAQSREPRRSPPQSGIATPSRDRSVGRDHSESAETRRRADEDRARRAQRRAARDLQRLAGAGGAPIRSWRSVSWAWPGRPGGERHRLAHHQRALPAGTETQRSRPCGQARRRAHARSRGAAASRASPAWSRCSATAARSSPILR